MILLIIIIVGVIGYYSYQYIQKQNQEKLEQKLVNEIKNSYHPIVEVTKNKTIYKNDNNQYKKIGVVSKNAKLELADSNVKTSDDKYFQIKDTNYYIDYQDLREIKEKVVDTSLDQYLVTKEITTNPTILYQDNDVLFFDMNYYIDEIGLDWKTDSKDGGNHLNLYGAIKVSDYIAEYIHENLEIPDRRSNKKYKNWNKEYKEYTKLKEENLNAMAENRK